MHHVFDAKRRRCDNAAPNLDTLPEDLFCHVISFCDRKMNRVAALHLVNRSVRQAMRSATMLSLLIFDMRQPINVLQLGTLAADVQLARFKGSSGMQTLHYTPKLRFLDLSYSGVLKNDNFNAVRTLSMLQTIGVSGCQITNLDVLTNLKSLRTLYASNCRHLTRLPDMPQLLKLDIDCCHQMVDVQALTNMTRLTWLSMSGSSAANQVLPTLPDSLVHLGLSYCQNLTDADLLPIKRLVNLTHLDLSGCKLLKSMKNLAPLVRLTELRASFCDALCNTKGLSDLKLLRVFHGAHSPLCESGELSLSGLVALEELELSSTTLITLDFPQPMPNLHTLRVHYCPLLRQLKNIANAPQLHTVNLSQNPYLEDSALAGFSKLLTLGDLCLRGCARLTVVGMRMLPTTIHRLILEGCNQLDNQTMVVLSNFSKLQRLDLQSCALISDEGLHELSAVRTLQYLSLSHCNRITDVGMFALSKLVHLRVIRFDSCRKITDLGLRALEPLTEIESLDFNRCKGLLHLKPLSELATLQFLNLSGCVSLTDDSILNLKPCKKLTTIYTNHCKRVSKECVEKVLRKEV